MNPSPGESALDTSRLEMLEKNMGHALVRIVDRYLDQCARALENLSVLIPVENREEVRALAHQMKGASSSLGLQGLTHWFRLLEDSARNGTPIPERWHENTLHCLEQSRLAIMQRSSEFISINKDLKQRAESGSSGFEIFRWR